MGIGNPVSHPSIKNYLKLIKEEQAKARVCPKKAVPLFLKKLQIIAQFILAQLQSPRISPISLYIFSRDLCFFTTDFFSGDRSSDLGRVLSREVLYFPDSSGILFNHTFGKTLRGDSVNTFAVRRCDNLVVCPVKNFERYIAVAKLIKINLGQGFLFRVTKGNNVTREPFIGSAVHGRLKFYLDQIQANDGETPHQLLTMSVGLVRRWLTTIMTSGTYYALMLQLRYSLRKLLALRAMLLWFTSPLRIFLLLSQFFHRALFFFFFFFSL